MLRSIAFKQPLNRTVFLKPYRHFTQLASASEVVDLEYDVFEPANCTQKNPLVILHGLLGSKRNWHSLSKAFLKDTNRPIYALDLRNHGSSPHASPMTYSTMASDVLHFCRKHSLENISLLGHSMGGKVAMSVALDPNLQKSFLSHLIIADIAPSRGPLSPQFRNYFKAMSEIESQGVKTRKEAQEILQPYESDAMVRAFILTNLLPSNAEDEGMKFRIPLDVLVPALPDLGDFPYEPSQRHWDGPTLVIKGSKSNYINHHNIPLMKEFFPAFQLETLNTGHWVHSEAPNDFKKLVVDFIQ